jgi:hypothetical protein
MLKLNIRKSLFIVGLIYASSVTLNADFSSSTTPSLQTGPPSSKPSTQPAPAKKAEPVPQYKPLKQPVLPPMTKPFGMPGVIGLNNGKWEGTDYLGYLSKNVGVDVEILRAENVPQVLDASVVEQIIAETFTKEDLIPHSDVKEGPPLPFLHLLLIIYPVDKDRYVIFGNGRLFEQIQVIRKDFIPAGYWQGITWENQDVTLSNGQQLNGKLRELAQKLGSAFAKRYRQYNARPDNASPTAPLSLPGAPESAVPSA